MRAGFGIHSNLRLFKADHSQAAAGCHRRSTIFKARSSGVLALVVALGSARVQFHLGCTC